jgi:proteasome lid subunit RPN8/RPN11
MMVSLAPTLRALIARHAAGDYPQECCGVLLGSLEPLAAHAALEARNIHPAARQAAYTLDPRDLVRAYARAAELGVEIMGFYHSHPDQPATPSAEDRHHAWPGYLYLIVSVDARGETELQAWIFPGPEAAPRAIEIAWNEQRYEP